MSRAPQSGDVRARGLGGVGGAARVQGDERNTRGPSAQPKSGQRGAYKPMAKASRAQRVSEGTVVVTSLATKNARGAKGPCGGHVGNVRTHEGMTGSPGSNHPGGRESIDKVRQLQRRLWVAAKRSPERRFHALMDRIWRDDVLQEAWRRVKRNRGAAGVDGATLDAVEQYGVERLLEELAAVLRAGTYRPQPVLRRYIPKADGRQRPLGIPTVRDRVAQMAATLVLEPIFEADFRPSSYGFRPKRSATQALETLRVHGARGGTHVLDADIRDYFGSIDHQRLLTLVGRRVSDRRVLKLLRQWLAAGVMEEGQWTATRTGTPQGGVISPILANIYLHYALDVWFQKMVIPHCHGEACLIRYADDFVCAFEKEEDALNFHEVLGKRLGKFGLELSAEKTRVIPFSAKALGKSSFDFLGFEFRWGQDRKGKPHLNKRTARKSLRNSQKRFNLWCRDNRHRRLPELFKALNAKLSGYYNYFGVYGNLPSLNAFFLHAVRTLWKHLNQRSQRKSYNWLGFNQLMEQFNIAKPHIVNRPKRAPMRVASGWT